MIRDWRIEADAGPAIVVENVRGWIRIENVTLIQADGNPDPAIHIALADHVKVLSIAVSDGASLLQVHTAEVVVAGVTGVQAPPRDPLPPACIRATDSTLHMRDVRLETPCGGFFALVNRTTLTAGEVIAFVAQGVLVSGEGSEVALTDSELVARNSKSSAWVPTLLSLAGKGVKTMELKRINLRAGGGTCLEVEGPPSGRVVVQGRDVVCKGASHAFHLAETNVELKGGFSLIGSRVGLAIHESHVQAGRLEVQEASTAIQLSGNSSLFLEQFDARQVETLVRATSGSHAEIQEASWDGGDVRGAVEVHELRVIDAEGSTISIPDAALAGVLASLFLGILLTGGFRD